MRVAAIFQEGSARVQAALPKYRSPDGSLELNAFVPGASNLSAEVTLRLPTAAVAATRRRLRALLYLEAGDREIDISNYVQVELPEN